MQPGDLLDGWHLGATYYLSVFALSLGVRVFMSALRSFERQEGTPYWPTFWALLSGRGQPSTNPTVPALVPDYWHPCILGTLELMTYPVLLRTDNLHVIGAWLGLKALAQWKAWSDHRVAFNRFLIGNALVLLISALLLAPMVGVTPCR